jgi:ATP-dependent RNA helicase DHX36
LLMQGWHLAALPVAPAIGKMLLMGAVFGCVEPILTIAAGLAHRDPFVLPMNKKEEADEVKRRLAGESFSDHVALLRAFDGYQTARRRGDGSNFAWRHFLSENTLRLMDDMRRQFRDLLSDAGFLRRDGGGGGCNHHAGNVELVKAVLCAGLSPNVVSVVSGHRKAKLRTREDGKVEAHPGSVNAWVGWFPGNWLVYSQKVKSTGIYIRDSSLVTDFALLLFGGQLSRSAPGGSGSDPGGGAGGGGLTMLQNWAHFATTDTVAELVLGLRHRLDRCGARRLADSLFHTHARALSLSLSLSLSLQCALALICVFVGMGCAACCRPRWTSPRSISPWPRTT